MRVPRALLTLLLWPALACSPRASEPRASSSTPESCEQQRQELIRLLEHLPDRAVAGAVRVALPEAALGGSLGMGPVLEVAVDAAWLDGEPLLGTDARARAEQFGSVLPRVLAKHSEASVSNQSAKNGRRLYVAAAADLDVRSLRSYLGRVPDGIELRLLFDAPPIPVASDTERGGHELAARVLAERDPEKRRALAQEGYESFARCSRIHDAVESVNSVAEDQRWPQLRAQLLAATRACSCETLDSGSLKHLVAAEQRAGAMAFGSLPISFLRDERCGASMPLRSIQKLLQQVEAFDAEFAGSWQEDALAFDRVITDERLLNYFCDALPGETLAALQRARASVYWRVAPTAPCEGWRFEPLSPGTPMGTWKRQLPSSAPALALHYWQGSEEIRVYGPQTQNSKPTDERSWECNQNLKMTGIDAQGITLEQGRWYFTEASCNAGSASEALVPGCVGRLLAGAPATADAPAPGSGLAPAPRAAQPAP